MSTPDPPAPATSGVVRPAWLRQLPRWLPGTVTSVAVLFAASAGQAILYDAWRRAGGAGSESARVISLAIAYVPACAALMAAWRLLDREPLATLGYRGPASRAVAWTVAGVLLGLALNGAVVGSGAAAGWYHFAAGNPRPGEFLLVLAALLVAGHFEELLVRGYLMQAFGRRWPLGALLGTSLLFAGLHALNPGVWDDPVTGAMAMAGTFLAGLMLGLLFLETGDLWVPTGVHVGWNACMALVFGIPVSGLRLPGMLDGQQVQPGSRLAGGAFGPEAGLPALVILTVACAVLLRRGLRTGLAVPSAGEPLHDVHAHSAAPEG